MEHLFEARTQFAISMVFHIVFAVYGIGLPLLMVLAERRWLRTGDDAYLTLARRWAITGGLLFAIGAVSGTVIAFELGLLWPRFMQFAGPFIGMPFSMEGFAFFLEAIFFALYLYGWNKLSKVAHFRCGIVVALSAVLSGFFVMDTNAWMNSPAGVVMRDGAVVGTHPLLAMLNPFASSEILHMTLAAYLTVGFGVAAVYARALLRHPADPLARRGFSLAFLLAAVIAPVQILSGHHSAVAVGNLQPPKLAAMEGLFHTTTCAPETIGGVPDTKAQIMRFGIPLPCVLSILMRANPKAAIPGLDAFSPSERPNTVVVHLSFQTMVACGFAFLGMGLWALLLRWRKRELFANQWFLRAVVACGALAILAVEAGWFVTEVGRQPWTAYHLFTTAQSVTEASSTIVPSLIAFSGIYVFLGWLLVWLLLRLGTEHDIAR